MQKPIPDIQRPIPVPDAVSKPFWDACNERRLIVQNCAVCDRKQFPPQPVCAECGWGYHLGWIETSGRGKIHGYAVTNDGRIVAWQPYQPFNSVVIELEEDPAIKFLSNLPGVPVDQVPVGANVEVEFIQVSPDQLIPEWRVVAIPASSPTSQRRRRARSR
jgi:hypothetical protein